MDYFGAKLTFVMGALGYAIASAAAGLSMNGLQMISFPHCARLLWRPFPTCEPCYFIVRILRRWAARKEFRSFRDGVGNGPGDPTGFRRNHRESISWRACLFANLVVAVPLVGVAMVVIRRRPARKQTERFNIQDALLATVALGLIIFGASRVGNGPSIILAIR